MSPYNNLGWNVLLFMNFRNWSSLGS